MRCAVLVLESWNTRHCRCHTYMILHLEIKLVRCVICVAKSLKIYFCFRCVRNLVAKHTTQDDRILADIGTG